MIYESTADQESNIAAAEHRAWERARMPKFYAVMDAHAHRSMQQTIERNRAAGIKRAYQRDIDAVRHNPMERYRILVETLCAIGYGTNANLEQVRHLAAAAFMSNVSLEHFQNYQQVLKTFPAA